MKRAISMLLASVMVTLALSGCGGTPTQETPTPQTGTTSQSSTTTTETTESTGEQTAPESSTRDVLTIDINTADEGVEFNPANDALAQLILDKFGIQFTVRNIVDTADYVLLAASDDLPEVFYNEPLYYIVNYINFIEQGYVKDIPQEMIDKYPAVRDIINTSDLSIVTKELYGGNYVLPKPDSMDRSLYIAERRGIFYRKDWAEKFGITSTPTNVDELYTMLRHFTFDDPDGNGTKDTWGLTSAKAGELRTWFYSWGVDPSNWVKDTDGTWTHGQLTKNNLEPLMFFRQLYDEGILDPEFAQIDHIQAMQKLAGGTVGAITRNADTDWINTVIVEQFGAANPGNNPFDMVGLIPILAKDANSQPYAAQYLLDMCSTQFSAEISDEKLDRYLEFHEWCMSDEGKSYKLGFEGQEWQKNSDGHYEYIKTAAGVNPSIGDLYKSVGLLNMPSWGFELACDYNWPMEIYGEYEKQVRDLSASARAARNPHALPISMSVKLISLPSKMEADSFNFTNAVAEIIMGTEPVEDMFDAMVQKAMDSGFREAIEEVNEYVQQNGITE